MNEIKTKTIRTVDGTESIVVVGSYDYLNDTDADIQITDDYSSISIMVNGKDEGSLKCDGFVNLMSIDQFQGFIKKYEEENGENPFDGYGSGFEAALVSGFDPGDIGVTAKLEDGTYTDNFDTNDYIQHQELTDNEDEWADIFIVFPNNAKITKIDSQNNSILKQFARQEVIEEIFNSNKFHFTYENVDGVGTETMSVSTDKDYKAGVIASESLPKVAGYNFIEEFDFETVSKNVYLITGKKDHLLSELESQEEFEYELHTKKEISISNNNMQNDPITNADGDSYDSKVGDFLDSVTDEETDKTDKVDKEEQKEMTIEELIKVFDDKEEEINNDKSLMDVDRDFQLDGLKAQKEKSIDNYYLQQHHCPQELELEDAIEWYKTEIEAIEGDEDNKKDEADLTDEENQKLRAYKTHLGYLVNAREQQTKMKKFQDTQFDFYSMSEKLNERMTQIMKTRVDDYYEDMKGIQYIDKESLQDVINSSTDEWEEVIASMVDDTDKVALGFEVKEGAVPGHATRESMVYVLVTMEWAFEGDIGDGLSHQKQWGLPTDFIREWKKMSWLFGDDAEDLDSWMDEDGDGSTEVDESGFDDLLSDLKSK